MDSEYVELMLCAPHEDLPIDGEVIRMNARLAVIRSDQRLFELDLISTGTVRRHFVFHARQLRRDERSDIRHGN